MGNRSFRTSDEQDRFIEDTGISVSELAQKGVENERVKRAAGVCAICGDLIYAATPSERNNAQTTNNGFAVVSGGAPAGNQLGLENHQEIDVCGPHYKTLVNSLTDDSVETPSLTHILKRHPEGKSGYTHYTVEREMVADAMPNTPEANLITQRQNILTAISSISGPDTIYDAIDYCLSDDETHIKYTDRLSE